MEFLIQWFMETQLYRGYLAKLPSPLNNVYFDVLVIAVLAGYFLYCIISKILDAIAFARLRKQSRDTGATEGGRAAGAQASGNDSRDRGTVLPSLAPEGDGIPPAVRTANIVPVVPLSAELAMASIPPLEERIESMNRKFEGFRAGREEEIKRLQARLDEVQEGDCERKREVEAAIEELRAQIEDLREVKEKETEELRAIAAPEEAQGCAKGEAAPEGSWAIAGEVPEEAQGWEEAVPEEAQGCAKGEAAPEGSWVIAGEVPEESQESAGEDSGGEGEPEEKPVGTPGQMEIVALPEDKRVKTPQAALAGPSPCTSETSRDRGTSPVSLAAQGKMDEEPAAACSAVCTLEGQAAGEVNQGDAKASDGEDASSGISEFDRLLREYEKTNALIAEIEGRGPEDAQEYVNEVPEESQESVGEDSGGEGAGGEGEPVGTPGQMEIVALPEDKRVKTPQAALAEPSPCTSGEEEAAKAIIAVIGCADAWAVYDMKETDKVRAVHAALAAGASIRQIAEITGISRSAVQRLSKKHCGEGS